MTDQTQDAQGNDQNDDSSVINELRQKLRAAEARAKESGEKAEAAALLVAETNKERVQQIVDAAGIENLDTDLVLERVEGIATAEKVVEVLKAFGHKLQSSSEDSNATETPAQPVTEPATTVASDLQATAEIGQRVADAAGGGAVKDSMSRLAEAKGPDDVIAQMAEEGLTVSYG